jgi:hypothetical protein
VSFPTHWKFREIGWAARTPLTGWLQGPHSHPLPSAASHQLSQHRANLWVLERLAQGVECKGDLAVTLYPIDCPSPLDWCGGLVSSFSLTSACERLQVASSDDRNDLPEKEGLVLARPRQCEHCSVKPQDGALPVTPKGPPKHWHEGCGKGPGGQLSAGCRSFSNIPQAKFQVSFRIGTFSQLFFLLLI